MTYSEWAEEYRQSAEQVKQKISDLRAERDTVSALQQRSIDNRIKILYGMYLDCMHTYEILARRRGITFES